MTNDNDNDDQQSVHVSDASISQYNTAQSNADAPSITDSVLAQTHSNNTIISSDPPEDHTGLSTSTPSTSQFSHQPSTPLPSNPPRNINVNQTHPLPLFTPRNQSDTSFASTTSHNYTSMDDFNKLSRTVDRLQNNMNYFNQNLNALTSQTNTLQNTLNTVNNTMHQTITTAVIEAMTRMQALPNHTPATTDSDNTQPATNVITNTPIPNTTTAHTNENHTSYTNNISMPSNISNISNIASTPVTVADVLSMTNQTKCSFPTYVKSMNVYEWKEMCILELASSKRSIHTKLIQYTPEGNPTLNPNLTREESQELFRLTVKAISPKIKTNFITVDMLKQANGIELWRLLIDRFKPIAKDDIQLVDMNSEFTNFKRIPKESDDSYIQRFEDKVREMDYYGIKPSAQLQAIVFLGGLNEFMLSDPIMNLRESNSSTYSSWVVEGNLKYTMTRARNYMDQKRKYSKTSNEPTITPPQPTQPNQHEVNRRHKTPTPTPRYQFQPPPRYMYQNQPHFTPPPSYNPNQQQMSAPNIDALKKQFKAELIASENKQDVIFNWRNKNKKSCVFHPGQQHKFFWCRVAQSICRECRQDHELHKALYNSSQSTRKLLEARQNGHANQPPRNQEQTQPSNTTMLPPDPMDNHHARRAQMEPNEAPTYSQVLLSPPTPPGQGYESGSNLSNSSYNSINEQIDPYTNICSFKRYNHSDVIKSILHPRKTNKTVSFHHSVKPLQQKKHSKMTIKADTLPEQLIQDVTIAITDSGASDDMSSNKDLFEYIVPLSKPRFAILGDDKTKLRVTHYGPMNYTMKGFRVRKMGYLVPKLGTTLLSIKQHTKYKGNYFHAENNSAVIAFPDAIIDIDMNPEMKINITPATDSELPYTFDEQNAILSTSCKRRKYTIVDRETTKYIPAHLYAQFTNEVRVKRLVREAKLPTRATTGSVGFDVCSIHDVILPPHSQTKVHTGLAMAIPKGIYLRLASRSGLALKGINVGAGVIDNDYRGEVQIVMQNSTNKPFTITKDSKIAQCVFEKNSIPCMIVNENLTQTARGTGGFGSTDKSSAYTFINRLKAKKAVLQNDDIRNAIKYHSTNNDSNEKEDEHLYMSTFPVPNKTKSCTSTSPVLPRMTASYSVNKSLPATASYSTDYLSQSTGFYNNNNFIKYINDIGTSNVKIQLNDVPPLSDEGHTATMRSKRRNTTPSQTPKLSYSDVWHIDIGFGPTTAIGGIRYCLMMVDKATRIRKIYPLKNLTTSIHRAFQRFLTEVGEPPKLLRTDFDKKLIGSTARQFLDEHSIPIESAPPKRQHQNGLVERAWQSAVIMARNWLKSALLPSTYWYYAVKRAVEISNISPIKINNKVTTPFEQVHQKKVDYRQLFPMFSTSYIKQTTSKGRHKNKWKSQSLKVICIGSCPDSDGLLFYHPDTKSIISCADNYKFDTYLPAGPQFGESFDGRFTFTSKSSLQNIHMAPSHEKSATVFFKESNTKYTPSKILSVPFDEEEDAYVIQTVKSGAIHHATSEELFDHDPTASPTHSSLNKMYPWLQHDSKITITIPEFDNKPRQGYLLQSDGDMEWYFIAGRKKTNNPILLADFQEKSTSMIHNSKLFKGWINSRHAAMARHVRITSNVLSHLIHARHVSAKDLIKMESPLSLLQHKKLHPNDKKIWDDSYSEEYRGLQALDTWEVISEDQYKQLKKKNKARLLPTMAISVIKKDGDGNPQRAKYRIVVLGNMDPYGWHKHDCFAPVLAQYELRLLLHLAVDKGCIPKQGDVSQAFCQAVLPPEEPYVARPPPGCPLTPTNAYWRLLKSLYGMKRSPRHWYDKCHEILKSIGLKRSPNSPCVFSGQILPDKPPLYLGLYVDDFIYFSESQEVEQHFEQEFAKHVTKVTYSHQVDYFLGIKFDCKRHSNTKVTINLSQSAFIENLLIQQNLHTSDVNTVSSPYRSGHPVDKIQHEPYEQDTQHQYTKRMQSIIGSLTWLSMSTRPDIATITNLLAKYVIKPSLGHIDAAKRVLRYLKGTKMKGLEFSTNSISDLAAYIKFPLDKKPVIALTDANWGPQDQSVPKRTNKPQQLELFKSRSLSGFVLWGNGPIHWSSKRQSLTARSTAEAEIIATDECVKFLLHMRNLCDDLNIHTFIFPDIITVYNDNAASIKWSNNMTTKGLRYIQIRENAVREAVQDKIVQIKHIAGKINIADIFTKEDKDTQHFTFIRDILLKDVPSFTHIKTVMPSGSEGGVKPNT